MNKKNTAKLISALAFTLPIYAGACGDNNNDQQDPKACKNQEDCSKLGNNWDCSHDDGASIGTCIEMQPALYGPPPTCQTNDDCANYAKIWNYDGEWYCNKNAKNKTGDTVSDIDSQTDSNSDANIEGFCEKKANKA